MSFQFNEDQVNDYHKSSVDQLEDLQEILTGPFFADVHSVLDVGCGDGKITASIAQQFPSSRVVGCDVSHAMIKFASKKYPLSEYPNLNFFERDGGTLGFEHEFDRILSFNCLHWIKDQRKVLEEIYTSLKGGGKMLIVACPKSSQDDLQIVCRKVIFSFKWFFHFMNFKSVHSFHSASEYRNMLKDIGFSVDCVEERNKIVVFPNREALEMLLKSVLTPLSHLPERKRPSFLDDIFTELVRKGKVNANGEIHLGIRQIEIVASKET